MKQKRLIALKHLGKTSFGGNLLKNSNAKSARPFSPRAAIHVVMRARKPFAMLKNGRRDAIASIVRFHARNQRVHVHRFANAGNHLHFLVECREKKAFSAFLRAVSGSVALFVRRAEGTFGGESVWLQRPWSRLVAASGQAFVSAWRYVDLNEIEGGCWGITRRDAKILQYGDIGPPRPWLRG